MSKTSDKNGYPTHLSDKIGIVTVGHGSRVPETKGIYEDIARKATKKTGLCVRPAYMKFGKPTITDSVKRFIDEGFKKVIVVPLFILPGMHVSEDIPIVLGLKEGETPDFGYDPIEVPDDVEVIYSNHIGSDDGLATVVLERVKEALL